MIRLVDVSAREGKIAILDVRLDLAAGATALMGGAEDGTQLLLATIAGAKRPARGLVTVLGSDATLPASRRAIGYVPLSPELPDALRVTDFVVLAAKVRGHASDAREALARFGLEGLGSRRLASLTRAQLRAVALAEAVASPAVKVLVVDEPFLSMEPSAVAAFAPMVASAPDRCTVFCTASPNDARDLASSYVLLSKGKVAKVGTAADLALSAPTDKARLAVVAEDPRALVAALALESGLLAVEMRGRSVIVVGADVESAARAVGRAVVASGTPILELSPENAA